MAWTNNDGLSVKFGIEEGRDAMGGEYGDFDPGSIHLIELEISPETVKEASGTYIEEAIRLPGGTGWGIHVVAAEVSTEVTLTGDVSVGVSGPTGAVATAFVAAATSWPAAGAAPVAGGGTWVATVQSGRLKGDRLLITVNTAVTAGKGYVRIWYRAVEIPSL